MIHVCLYEQSIIVLFNLEIIIIIIKEWVWVGL